MFKEGKTITEIAAERNLVAGTIEGHLAYFVELGGVNINDLLSPVKRNLIREAILKHGTEVHKKMMGNVPASISYGEVKIMLASLKKSPTGLPSNEALAKNSDRTNGDYFQQSLALYNCGCIFPLFVL